MTVSKEVYKKRKMNNLCTRCGKDASINKTLCIYHLQKANKNQNAVHARRRKRDECLLCGQKLCNNRKVCNNCLEKRVSKQRDDVWIPYRDRHENGLCFDCGKDNSTSNLYCYGCSKERIINQSLSRQQKILNGLCGVCGIRLLVNNKKRCIICIHKYKQWYSTSPTRINNMKKNKLAKNQVIDGYGGKCNCCGEVEKTFLAIDHIDGGGNKHRKNIGKLSSSSFYRWLIEQNFPDEFQILCHNCNMSKYLCGGICAHKKKD